MRGQSDGQHPRDRRRDAVALAIGEEEFELDAMTPMTNCAAIGTDELLGRSPILVTPLRPDVGYDKQLDAIIDRQDMVDPGVARI
jgi:hypothetical protein